MQYVEEPDISMEMKISAALLIGSRKRIERRAMTKAEDVVRLAKTRLAVDVTVNILKLAGAAL